MAKRWYNNGKENKLFEENSSIPEGFVLGSKVRRDGKKAHMYNNGEKNIQVVEGDPIPEGFVPGMKKRSEEEREATRLKTKKTNMERYGGYSWQSGVIREKIRKTNLERYGVENPSQAQCIKDKKVKTSLEHYGTEYPWQTDEVKKAIENTCRERYGTKAPSQNEKVKEKAKQTFIERYGVENPMQSEEIKDRLRRSNIRLYGVDNPSKSDIIKEKITSVCQEKYGVNWTCQIPEVRRSSSNDSEPNREFKNILDSYGVDYELEFRIKSYSYDFKIGDILIEIDPYPYHNTLWNPHEGDRSRVTEDYHKRKSEAGESQGYQVIHIFDWDDRKKVVESLLVNRDSVYARSTVVSYLDGSECREFLNNYHLQGSCNGQSIALCLKDIDSNVISIMTFGSPRYNKNYQYELLRYCSSKNVIGGAQKLFKHFIKTYNPESVISYCDRSKFRGDVYKKLGFTLKTSNKPSKHWYNMKDGRHITDNLLRQRGFDQLFGTHYGKGTSNEQLMIEHSFVPIYDCGQDTYVWSSK